MPLPDVNMGNDEQQSAPSSPRKRQRRQTQNTELPRSKKARTSTATQQVKKAKGRKGWSIPLKDVPTKARSLQCALRLHIRILWRLFSQHDVPPPVGGSLLNDFQQRFQTSDHVQSFVDGLVSAVNPASQAAVAAASSVQQAAHQGTSQIAKETKWVEEAHLLAMFGAVARAGLPRWAPDVFGTPESMYNATHELLALSTFKNVAASFGYTFLAVDLSYLQNHTFLTKLYCSFVFGHMAEKAHREGKAPGRVARDVELMNIYWQRNHLRETRVKQLKDDGFSKAVVHLAEENEAHSDDELDPNSPPNEERYLIRIKEGRAPHVTELFRFIDIRYQQAQQRKAGTRTNRVRAIPAESIGPSKIPRFPVHVSLDYFEPEFYNSMSVRERLSYMNNGVALPKPEHCQRWADVLNWKNLSKKEFMEKFGNNTLAQYAVPTEAELEQLWAHDNDKNLDEDEDEDENKDESEDEDE
ncbi:hypothetical protein D9757_005172 [Collybiopsis confluens]|uniref:Uncharacterized protein n=1 Tax=Collybiopsis confluens TaxID=2823264 RepID=A0A8H5MDW1_9AGAR|nr:hypothetical protein D9757_005172 [Collybiopsis confluens]